MKLRFEIVLIVIIFAVLGFAITYAVEQSDQSAPGARATSFSSRDEGTLALYRWLSRTYNRVERLAYQPFTLTPNDGLLFVLGPSDRYEPAAVNAVSAWVNAGGVLVVVDDIASPRSQVTPLLAAFALQLERAPFAETVDGRHPALGSPPVTQLAVKTNVAVAPATPDVGLAPLAGAPDRPIIASRQFGDGHVIAVSSLYPFTNEGLRQPAAAALVINLLRWAPPGKRILFDEFHHGFRLETNLRSLLVRHPFGWAIIYALTITGLYLVVGSRRFARPLPLRSEAARRSSAEYIDSMAGMLRRARHYAYAGQHYHAMLRRRLGQPYGLSLALDDDTFVAELARMRPIDSVALRRVLTELRRPDLSEADLLRLIDEADRLG